MRRLFGGWRLCALAADTSPPQTKLARPPASGISGWWRYSPCSSHCCSVRLPTSTSGGVATRAGGYRPPRCRVRLLLTKPDDLTGGQAESLARAEAACPEMTALARLVRDFTALLTPDPGNDDKLQEQITSAREADLPCLHSFTRGPDLDIDATTTTALTMPYHNGRE